ncbi:MAG: type II secretion system protein N, partial [Proteobacteria bacterium]|nr:type II secretion system protein N [Pseudomonadota bacterium]
MKRTVGVIVFGVVAFGAIVLARLPASWVLPRASANFSCSSVAGSLWNGYCSGLRVRGAALGDLTWQVRPARLLLGKLAAHVDLEQAPAIFARGDVEIGLGGTLVAHDLTASL